MVARMPERKKNKARNQSALDAALESIRNADVLVAGPASNSIATWLASNFNRNFDAYDRAIDAAYNADHIGGSMYHHLLDGQHTLWGALESVKNISPHDSFASELAQAGEHLLRDTMSVSGINPLLSPRSFETIAHTAQATGISRAFIADALTINGSELLGGAIALTATLALGRKFELSRLSALSGSYVASALVSGNPLLLPIAAGGLVYSLVKADDKKAVLINGGKGAIVSGSALLVSSLVGGPVWVGCVAAILTGVAIKYGLDNSEKVVQRSRSIATTAGNILQEASRTLRERNYGAAET